VVYGKVVAHAAHQPLVVDKGSQHRQRKEDKADPPGQPHILHPAADAVTTWQVRQQYLRQRQ